MQRIEIAVQYIGNSKKSVHSIVALLCQRSEHPLLVLSLAFLEKFEFMLERIHSALQFRNLSEDLYHVGDICHVDFLSVDEKFRRKEEMNDFSLCDVCLINELLKRERGFNRGFKVIVVH